MKRYPKPPLCLWGAINLKKSLTASSQRDGMKLLPYDYTECPVPCYCKSFLANKSDKNLLIDAKKVCFSCVESLEDMEFNFPELTCMRLSTDSFKQEICFFFIPCWCFSPTCCSWKEECWSFMSFKRQHGSILSWILKMIVFCSWQSTSI